MLSIESLGVIIFREGDDLSYTNPFGSNFLILDREHFSEMALMSIIARSSASETPYDHLHNVCRSLPSGYFFTPV